MKNTKTRSLLEVTTTHTPGSMFRIKPIFCIKCQKTASRKGSVQKKRGTARYSVCAECADKTKELEHA